MFTERCRRQSPETGGGQREPPAASAGAVRADRGAGREDGRPRALAARRAPEAGRRGTTAAKGKPHETHHRHLSVCVRVFSKVDALEPSVRFPATPPLRAVFWRPMTTRNFLLS